MWSWIVFGFLGWICAGLMTWVSYRFYRKAVIYDEIFQFIYDDIDINVRQFRKMASGNVLSDEPEVQNAHKNMIIMGKRLIEIVRRMEEATGLKLTPPPPPKPPSVI